MCIARIGSGAILALLCVCLQAQTANQEITVTGKLVHAMAIGAETTGWALELETATTIDGKEMNSIQVSYADAEKLRKFENKSLAVTGKVAHRQGVETGEQTILEISSIGKAKGTASGAPAFNLASSEWRLENLVGEKVLDNVQATLVFPVEGRVAGNGSCNRFTGTVEIKGNTLKFGPLAATRMACPEAEMDQEAKYLQALQAAERFEWREPYLLIYSKGFEKPLRFTKKAGSAATP